MTITDSLLITMDSDFNAYSQCLEIVKHETGAREVLASMSLMLTPDEAVRFSIEDTIKDYVETLTDDVGSGGTGLTYAERSSADCIIKTLCSSALGMIDWKAVAKHYIEKVEAENA